VLLLEAAGAAAERGAPVLAEVLGHGSAFAAAPDEAGKAEAVARAVRLALEDAGLAPEGVDCLSVSANGSVVGDRCEALGVAEALGARAASLPVTAIKAMLGEAMGASGGFQAVAALDTLGSGMLPGIRGLERTEDRFPLPGVAAGSRRIEARTVLLTAVGHDGHCCAVLLSAPGGGR
jgi:3-oxoacyl-(acyl-carrier-protein) synthase